MLEVRGSSVLRQATSVLPANAADALPTGTSPEQRPPRFKQSSLQTKQHPFLRTVGSHTQRSSLALSPSPAEDSLLAAVPAQDARVLLPSSGASQRSTAAGSGRVGAALGATLTAAATAAVSPINNAHYLAAIWDIASTEQEATTAGPSIPIAAAAAAAIHMGVVMARPSLRPSPSLSASGSLALQTMSELPPTVATSNHLPAVLPSQLVSLPLQHPPHSPKQLEPQQPRYALHRSVSTNSNSSSSTASRGGISFGSSGWVGSSTCNSDVFSSTSSRSSTINSGGVGGSVFSSGCGSGRTNGFMQSIVIGSSFSVDSSSNIPWNARSNSSGNHGVFNSSPEQSIRRSEAVVAAIGDGGCTPDALAATATAGSSSAVAALAAAMQCPAIRITPAAAMRAARNSCDAPLVVAGRAGGSPQREGNQCDPARFPAAGTRSASSYGREDQRFKTSAPATAIVPEAGSLAGAGLAGRGLLIDDRVPAALVKDSAYGGDGGSSVYAKDQHHHHIAPESRKSWVANQHSSSSSGSPSKGCGLWRSSSGGGASMGSSSGSGGGRSSSSSSVRRRHRGHKPLSKQLLKSDSAGATTTEMVSPYSPRVRSRTPSKSPQASSISGILAGYLQLHRSTGPRSNASTVATEEIAMASPSATAATSSPNSSCAGGGDGGTVTCSSKSIIQHDLAVVYGLVGHEPRGISRPGNPRVAPQILHACTEGILPRAVLGVSHGASSASEVPATPAVDSEAGTATSGPVSSTSTMRLTPPPLRSRLPGRVVDEPLQSLLLSCCSSNSITHPGSNIATGLLNTPSSISGVATTAVTAAEVRSPSSIFGIRMPLGSAGASSGPPSTVGSSAAAAVAPMKIPQSAPHSPKGAIGTGSWRRSLEPIASYPFDIIAGTSAVASAVSTTAAVAVGRLTGDGGGGVDYPPVASMSPPRLQPMEPSPPLPVLTQAGASDGSGGSCSASLHQQKPPGHLAPLDLSEPTMPPAATLAATATAPPTAGTVAGSEAPLSGFGSGSTVPLYHVAVQFREGAGPQLQHYHHQHMCDTGGGLSAAATAASSMLRSPSPILPSPISPFDWRKPLTPPVPPNMLQPPPPAASPSPQLTMATATSAHVAPSPGTTATTTGNSPIASSFFVSGCATALTGSAVGGGRAAAGGGSHASPARGRAITSRRSSPARSLPVQIVPASLRSSGGAGGGSGGADTDGGELGSCGGSGCVTSRGAGPVTSEHVRKAQERLEAYSRMQKEKARSVEAEEATKKLRQVEERNRHAAQRERRRVEVYALNALLARSEAARTQLLIKSMTKAVAGRGASAGAAATAAAAEEQSPVVRGCQPSDLMCSAGGRSGDGCRNVEESGQESGCSDEEEGEEERQEGEEVGTGLGSRRRLKLGEVGCSGGGVAVSGDVLRHGV